MYYNYQIPKTGVIKYFIRHNVHLRSVNDAYGVKIVEHVFASVKWLKEHEHHNYYGASAIMCSNTYDPSSMCSFLPV